MYIHLGLLARALRLAFGQRPVRPRYLGYVLFFTTLYACVWLTVAVGRALDHLFFPAFRRQGVREPLFVVAPPRSGTTLTQRLLCYDEERFVHSKLYQTIFPCVLHQRLIEGAVRLDARLGGPLRRAVEWAEKRFFGGWDDMHALRFDQPEEDDGYFVYTFVTEAIYLLFPFVDELWEAGFADALPPVERKKLMRYYRSCLQRQLYANGPEKTLLSKCTQSCGALQALQEEFPDARFLTILRHPYESVASHVSVFYPVWSAHSPQIAKDSDTSRSYARLSLEWYRHLVEMRSSIAPERYAVLDYRDLVRDPAAAIEGVYAEFGWTPSPAYRARLAAARSAQGEYKSRHRYTLEEYGLSRAWISAQIGDVLDACGFER